MLPRETEFRVLQSDGYNLRRIGFPRLRSLSVSQCVRSGKEAIVSVEIN